jgi:hypothetical protein
MAATRCQAAGTPLEELERVAALIAHRRPTTLAELAVKARRLYEETMIAGGKKLGADARRFLEDLSALTGRAECDQERLFLAADQEPTAEPAPPAVPLAGGGGGR